MEANFSDEPLLSDTLPAADSLAITKKGDTTTVQYIFNHTSTTVERTFASALLTLDLAGDSEISIVPGEPFVDPWDYTSLNVTRTGDVNVDQNGEYTLTYSKEGYEDVTRTVIVPFHTTNLKKAYTPAELADGVADFQLFVLAGQNVTVRSSKLNFAIGGNDVTMTYK